MKDAGGHGSESKGLAGNHLPVWYHGSPSGFPGKTGPIHVGTRNAAAVALEARIGIPADGKGWDGTREYGKTLIAGTDTMNKMERTGYNNQGFLATGYNSGGKYNFVSKEDYYPTVKPAPKYSDGKTEVAMNAKPAVRAYQINGSMGNTPDRPYSDMRANALAKAQQTRGNGKNGFYYKNDAEDAESISAVVPSRAHLTGQFE